MPIHVPKSANQVFNARKIIAAVLAATFAGAGCSGTTEPLHEVPAPATALIVRLDPLTQTSVTGTVGTPAPVVPAVRATDKNGKPIRGVEVSFVTDGTIRTRAERTDADGVASVGAWILKTSAGTNTVTAHVPGSDDVRFTAKALPGPVARLFGSGNEQFAFAGTTLRTRLSVKVNDSYGNAVSGVTVEFTVVSGGGSLESGSAVSDSGGVATSGPWTLGASPATQKVTAIAAGVVATFIAHTCAGTCRSTAHLLYVWDGDIFTMDLGNSNTVQLTFDGHSYDPASSPDGSRIAFVRYDAKYVADIYLMNADGSSVVPRTTGADFHSPAWSPDGNTLAVAAGTYYTGSIRLLSVREKDGIDTQLASMATDPAWSPDGKQIAFVSLSGDDCFNALHLMNADGSGISAVTVRDEGCIEGPTWSPDGQRI
ncbi:MAG: PD40 domain-containing protein, partial [Gemmatimonadaceae bacterium]|nr:PD40 domain-containing protein [Gemmatimonadaceae bacterium]